MISLDIATIIDRPISQVFNFMSTPENDFEWQYCTLATASLSDGASTIGTFFRSVGHLQGRRVQGTFEVTEYELNRRFGFKSLSGPLHSQTSYTFERTDGGTRIHVAVQARVANFFQVDERMLEKNIKKQLKGNLTLLKNLLEEQVSNPETFPLAG